MRGGRRWSKTLRERGSAVSSMDGSMDAQATSPAGQPATDQPRAPTAQGAEGTTAVPAGRAAGAEAPPGQDARGGVDVPTRVEVPAGQETRPAGMEAPAGVEIPTEPRAPGFRERGRMRRRLRFLRKARELAYRDLGGLVFEMHRLSERHDELVAAKLAMLGRFDEELRALESALGARRPITVLREAGIEACPRCAAIHGSGDRFCPACGQPLSHHADLPVAATPAAVPPTTTTAVTPTPPVSPTPAPKPKVAPAPAPTPAPTPTPTPTPPATLTSTPPPSASPAAAPSPVSAQPSPPPPQTANPPVPAPKAEEEDRPTEIIRPPDGAR